MASLARRLLVCALIGAWASAPSAAVAAAAAQQPSRPPGLVGRALPLAAVAKLGYATFDPRRSVVNVPYAGAAPKATLFKLSPGHFYYELAPARLSLGNVQMQALGGAVQRFTLAARPTPNVVRLSFQLSAASEPVLRVDPVHHRLVVLPLGHEAISPSSLAAVPHGLKLPTGAHMAAAAHLERPYVGDRPRRFVLPFQGEVPQFVATTYQRNPRWIIVDLYGAEVHLVGGRSGALRDPFFEGWMLSPRPEPSHVRLYLRTRSAAHVQASLGGTQREIWLIVGPAPAPGVQSGPQAPMTAKPAAKASVKPVAKPSAKPAAKPSPKPAAKPSAKPTTKPTVKPTIKPTAGPETRTLPGTGPDSSTPVIVPMPTVSPFVLPPMPLSTPLQFMLSPPPSPLPSAAPTPPLLVPRPDSIN